MAGNQATAHTALVHRFVDEFWSRGNLSVVDELMTRDAVIHEPVAGTPEDLKAVATMIRTAFPDWHSTVEEIVVEGDRVAERWTGRGTHQGEFQGILRPASGWRCRGLSSTASPTARSPSFAASSIA